MKRKAFILLTVLLVFAALSCQAASAADIEGSWKGRITASKYGFSVSRSAKVVFTADGGYTLNTGAGDSVGTFVLTDGKIKLTSSGGRVLNLSWSLKGDTLTMKGAMDVGGFSNVSTKMVVKKEIPRIISVFSPKVEYGNANIVTIKGNALTDCVKITTEDGTELAQTSKPFTNKIFELDVKLSEVRCDIRVYAGETKDGGIIWHGYKKFTLKTYPIAYSTKIISVKSASKNVSAGETVELTITANSETSRVRVVGASTVESEQYETVGKKRVFKVSYSQTQAVKKQQLKVFSGDELGFKITPKTIKVNFVD